MSDNGAEPLEILLFVFGENSSSMAQRSALEDLLARKEQPIEAMKAIDLSEFPDLALEYEILAIPTVLRVRPGPSVRIIGEMTDQDRVWRLLSS